MAEGICAGCGENKLLKARGLCRACYQQWKRTGSTERERQPRGMCTVPGCDKPAHGKGLCDMHIKRMKVSGSLDDPRADNVNLRSNHALYSQWQGYTRTKSYPIIDAWRDDFFAFLAGVGERPSKDHRLYRLDKDQPMGPDNFEWREKFTARKPEEGRLEYNNRYRKLRKDVTGSALWDSELRARYGVDFGTRELQAMVEAQKGLCAISGLPETSERDGRVRQMSVDHDHTTLKVRQLLRSVCNTIIGLADDDPMLLAKAILYLGKHAEDVETGQYMVNRAIAYLQRHPVNTLDRTGILPQD